jgi:hypothetical protein
MSPTAIFRRDYHSSAGRVHVKTFDEKKTKHIATVIAEAS